MPEVLLDGVSLEYGDVLALDAVDLGIVDGEFMVIVGPSGSGKTSLLRVIAGLQRQSAGHVSIGGRVVDRVPPAQRGLALLSQEMALYPHMTVRANLEFPLKVRHTDASAIAERVEAIAGELRVTRLLDTTPGKLSVGQRQAVATGRTMVGAAPLVLLDEPFAQVDAAARQRLRRELRSLRELERATVVMATNDQETAMSLGDRLVVLEAGRVQQVAPPRQVYRRPANVFVGGFVGTMNLMQGVVVGSRPTVVQLGSRSITLHGAERNFGEPGAEVVVGLRPEALRYGAAGPGDGPEQRLGGTVAAVEHLGGDQLVRIATDVPAPEGGGTVELEARLPGDAAVRRGSHLALAFDPGRLHFFDPVTGFALW